MGSFVFKWPHPDAQDVHVTGDFDNWRKTQVLNKVGDVWEKEVELAQTDKKIHYKFVVNGEWLNDPQAPQEPDDKGNINNVLLPEQIKLKPAVVPEAVTTSSAAPESTTAALAGQVPLEPRQEATEVAPEADSGLTKETTQSSLPGAFPETPMNGPDSFVVNPIPASSGAGNPLDLPAGEKVPASGEVTSNTIQSTVTTSKEDYEKAGSTQTAPDSYSVNPLPATSGPGNPVDLPAGEAVPPASEVTANTVQSTATTSEEDYEKAGSTLPIIGGALAGAGVGAAGLAALSSDKKENLIPESSLPMGTGAGEALDAGPTIGSAAPSSTTADLAGQVPLEEKKAATVVDPQATTDTVPEVVKESIAEAHTDPEATTSAEAVKEKAEVEQELLKKVPSSDEAGEPAPTIAAATSATAPSATTAPSTVPGMSSTAAAAVADGADGTATPSEVPKTTAPVEKTEADNTEYAPPKTTTDAPGVSGSAAAAVSDGAEDPTLADEPAVQMMNQNDNEAAEAAGTAPAPEPESVPAAGVTTTEAPKEAPKAVEPAASAAEPKKETAETPATTSSATSTPTKKAAITPTSSPASAGTKEKKKKHRISSLFKKIFE